MKCQKRKIANNKMRMIEMIKNINIVTDNNNVKEYQKDEKKK